MDVVLKELYLSEDENGSPKEKNIFKERKRECHALSIDMRGWNNGGDFVLASPILDAWHPHIFLIYSLFSEYKKFTFFWK